MKVPLVLVSLVLAGCGTESATRQTLTVTSHPPDITACRFLGSVALKQRSVSREPDVGSAQAIASRRGANVVLVRRPFTVHKSHSASTLVQNMPAPMDVWYEGELYRCEPSPAPSTPDPR